MQQIRSIICVFLAFLMVISFSVNPALAKSDKDQNNTITQHEPKSRMSEVKKGSKQGGGGWLWGILGVAVVAGAVAALAGGGGDGGGGGDDGPVSTTGNYDFTW
jgi:hypothetical protein